MALIALANPQVTVDGQLISVKPNSVKYTEGFGEQIVRAASGGGGAVEQVFADDITDNFSMIGFEIDPDPDLIDFFRAVKATPGVHTVILSGEATIGTQTKELTRTFQHASLISNYEVPLGADTAISIEFKSDPAK